MATKVLLIEDDEDIRLVIGEGLKYLGMTVTSVPSAEKALMKLKFDQPDVILLDMGLPGISGWDLAKKLQHGLFSEIPIIALTGSATVGAEQKALSSGCSAYLAKPCELPDVKHKIEEVLSKRKGF